MLAPWQILAIGVSMLALVCGMLACIVANFRRKAIKKARDELADPGDLEGFVYVDNFKFIASGAPSRLDAAAIDESLAVGSGALSTPFHSAEIDCE